MKTHGISLNRLVTVSLVLLLAPWNQATSSPSGESDTLRALLHGPVESAYYEPFRGSIEEVTYDGSQNIEDFDMLIFDGDVHTPGAVSEDELIQKALRMGKVVLAVDVTKAHKEGGLSGILNALFPRGQLSLRDAHDPGHEQSPRSAGVGDQ